MKYVRASFSVLVLLYVSVLMAQVSPLQQLADAFALELKAQPAKAIASAQTLIDAKVLDSANTGRAWDLLGLAYEDQGRFLEVQHAYEQASHIFEALPSSTSDYAAVIDNLGSLYRDMGRVEIAIMLRRKALHLYEQIGDHAGMARANQNLTGLELSQNHVREGRKYLKHAFEEEKLAKDIEGDDLAAIASMQGWLADVDGNTSLAISSYQRALNLWRGQNGEEHPLSGWGYMLLGRAYLDGGDVDSSLAVMRKGLAILERTLEHHNPRYLTAEMAYSDALQRAGSSAQAAQIKMEAQQGLKDFYRSQCTGCTISVQAFR